MYFIARPIHTQITVEGVITYPGVEPSRQVSLVQREARRHVALRHGRDVQLRYVISWLVVEEEANAVDVTERNALRELAVEVDVAIVDEHRPAQRRAFLDLRRHGCACAG